MNIYHLDLAIPQQEKIHTPGINRERQSVEKALQAIPLGDIPAALHECTSMLATLNRIEINTSERTGIMACFDYYYGVFESYYRPATTIKCFQAHSNSDTQKIMELRTELANGYKIVLMNAMSSTISEPDLASIIYMTMYYQGQCLLHCYDRFEQHPPHIWHEINQLYRFAESINLHQINQRKTFEPETATTTSDLYKQILLLEAANPYHMNSGEHWVLYHYLGHWSSYVTLDRKQDQEDVKEFFMVDITQSDKPFSNHSHQPSSAADIRIINNAKLLSFTKQHIKTLNSGSTSTSVGMPAAIHSEHAARLLEQAYSNWTKLNIRENLRMPINAMAGLVWGIHSIHNQLLPCNNSIHNKTAGKIINESHGGFCLKLNKADQQDLFNGQVIAMRSDRQSSSRWTLGIVRWQQTLSDQQKMVGIEYIRGAVRPIKFQTLDDSGPADGYRTGLLVTQKNHGRQQHSLLASRGMYNTGREINLNLPQKGRQYDIRAAELLTQTALVDRFSFKAA